MPNKTTDNCTTTDLLDEFQRQLVLSAFAGADQIIDTVPYRPDYANYGPNYTCYPLRITVRTAAGNKVRCVLKKARHAGELARDAALLPVLRSLGLAVQEILTGPATQPDDPAGGELLVLRELPGEPLPFVGADLDAMDLTCRLLPKAIRRLHELTDAVRASPARDLVPEQTLLQELDQIRTRGGPWMQHGTFARAVERLRPVLMEIDTPLAFTNGDYNVTNFLHTNGELSGWIDFCLARFEDPHASLSKFVVWSFDRGWATGAKAGLVERYLYQQNVSRREFAPRLAVRCLRLIQTEVPISGQQDARYRAFALQCLRDCLECIG